MSRIYVVNLIVLNSVFMLMYLVNVFTNIFIIYTVLSVNEYTPFEK